MHKLISKLIVYRSGVAADSILCRLSKVTEELESKNEEIGLIENEALTEVNRLLDLATRYGFDNNLWQNYLSYILAMTETPFTLVSEKAAASEGSVKEFAKSDLLIFKKLFNYDFSELDRLLGMNCFSVLQDYKAVIKSERIYNKSVSEKVRLLSEKFAMAPMDGEALYKVITDFYREYGVGLLGLNKAFRLSSEGKGDFLEPITLTSEMTLSDLVGYESQKKKLIDNTEAFVSGKRANNVLLYGDAGTGKSSSIKAILNMYYGRGLRMIEIYKHEFRYLSKIMALVKNRNYRFIIYMDDLSFEDFETDYKYLKAVIEGGLEPRPENVLIYATSNRRHLIKENFSDRPSLSDEDVHRSDSMQEKLSLSSRFGLTISYFKPMQKDYFNIVRTLAAAHPEIRLSEEELLKEANKWELEHGGMTGRAARQFIDHLSGLAN